MAEATGNRTAARPRRPWWRGSTGSCGATGRRRRTSSGRTADCAGTRPGSSARTEPRPRPTRYSDARAFRDAVLAVCCCARVEEIAMLGAVLHGPKDIRFERRADPRIVEPTDAIL